MALPSEVENSSVSIRRCRWEMNDDDIECIIIFVCSSWKFGALTYPYFITGCSYYIVALFLIFISSTTSYRRPQTDPSHH